MGSTEMNDSRSPRRTDLQGRRRLLGATRRAMAAGIGLRIDQVTEIEEGTAPDALRNLYAQWLERLEGWPADKRASQLLAAEESRQRFRPWRGRPGSAPRFAAEDAGDRPVRDDQGDRHGGEDQSVFRVTGAAALAVDASRRRMILDGRPIVRLTLAEAM